MNVQVVYLFGRHVCIRQYRERRALLDHRPDDHRRPLVEPCLDVCDGILPRPPHPVPGPRVYVHSTNIKCEHVGSQLTHCATTGVHHRCVARRVRYGPPVHGNVVHPARRRGEVREERRGLRAAQKSESKSPVEMQESYMCDAGGHSSEKARHGRKRHRAVHLPHGTRALVGRRHTAGAFEAPGARSLGRLAPPRGHVVVAAPRVGRRRLEELGGRREHGGVDLGHVDQAVHAALEVLERGDARVGDGSGLVGAHDGLGRRRPDRALDLPFGHALGASGAPVAHLLLDVRADPRLGPVRPVLDEQAVAHLANHGHVEPVVNARAKRAADDLDLVVARGAPLLDGGNDGKPPALVASLGDEVD